MPTPFLPTEIISRIVDYLLEFAGSHHRLREIFLRRLCRVDRRFYELAKARLYQTVYVQFANEEELSEHHKYRKYRKYRMSRCRMETVKDRPHLASLVRGIEVKASGRDDDISLRNNLGPSIALISLTPNVRELSIDVDPEYFDAITNSLLNVRPPLRTLTIRAGHSDDGIMPSTSSAALFRVFPHLEDLDVRNVAIHPDDTSHPPTLKLKRMVFKTPFNFMETKTATFDFVTSASTHSLRHLHLHFPNRVDPDEGHNAHQDCSALKGLETLKTTMGELDEDSGEHPDLYIRSAKAMAICLRSQLGFTPPNVRQLIISEPYYDPLIPPKYPDQIPNSFIFDHELLGSLPAFVHTVELSLELLEAKTLQLFLKRSPPLDWTRLTVVTSPCFGAEELEGVVSECQKRGITFVAR